MSKKANKTAIGIFVVGAIVLAIAAVVIFGSGKYFTRKSTYVAFFSGSAKGLRIGAPVAFRGVRIGSVTDVRVKFIARDLSFRIPVFFQIETDRFSASEADANLLEKKELLPILIERGLRAQLDMQSFVTGQLLINLDFHPDSAVDYHIDTIPEYKGEFREMPTIPTSFEKIRKALDELPLTDMVEQGRRALAGIEQLVNSPEVGNSLQYLEQTLKNMRDLVRHMDTKIDPLAASMQPAIGDAQKMVNNVDSQIVPLAASVKKTSVTARAALNDARKLLKNADGHIDPIGTRLEKSLDSAKAALDQAEKTLATVEEFTAENSQFRYHVFLALEEFSAAARSFRALTDYLGQNPDALLRGKTGPGGK
jgi:paraquat-inducible protein B